MAELNSSATTSKKIRVLAADSTRMNSQLLADALSRDSRLEIIEAEPQAAATLAAVSSEKPDVVLLSPALEDNATLGFQVARDLMASHPQGRIIMLLDAADRSAVLESFRAGARGVFCRTESLKTLAKCIDAVYAGQVWANSRELGFLLDAVSQSMPSRVTDLKALSLLSKREQDVVRCVVEGLSNREIASRLGLTEHTVKNYLFRVFDKLGVSSRVEVVLYAFSHGPANPSPQKPDSTSDAATTRAASRSSAR
jgi:DNA-binding NarL/FixJ family response regulator